MEELSNEYEMDSTSEDNDDSDEDDATLESEDSNSDIEEPAAKRRRRAPTIIQHIENNYGWTHSEKQNLFNALTTHGAANITLLADSVPTKTPQAIKAFITNCEKLARLSLKEGKGKAKTERKAPIDKWLDYTIKSSNTENFKLLDFARAIKYIALFEPKSESKDINIGDCYEVLSNLLRGDATKCVNQESAMFLLKNVRKLASLTKETNHDAEKEFFKTARSKNVVAKTYGSKKKVADEATEESILRDEVINPLQIPKNLL